MYANVTALRERLLELQAEADVLRAKANEIRPILEDFQQPGGGNSLRAMIEAVIEELLEEEE